MPNSSAQFYLAGFTPELHKLSDLLMSVPFDYDNVGLGLSFQQPELKYVQSPVVASQATFPDHQFGHGGRSNHDLRHDNLQYGSGGHHHYRSQSAAIPQRSTFERMSQQVQAPRSAMPMQQPFNAGMMPPSYTHSAPTTPSHEIRQPYIFQAPQTEHRDGSERQTVYDRRQQRKRLDSRPPPPQPQYYSSPRFMDPPVNFHPQGHDGRSGVNDSPASNGSYFYMTPQIQSTPFSDIGQFPIPEPFGNQSTAFNTPHLSNSPVFEGYRGQYDAREHLANYVNQSDMPDGPYVPTEVTDYPPSRSSALRSTHYDQDHRLTESEAEEGDSHQTSPASSPPGTPYNKDRKVAYSRWTSDEDLLLKEAISIHGDGKWSLVSQMVPGRTPMQCSTRWQGALNTTIHKGRWDPEEDAILIKAVAEWQSWHLAETKTQQREDIHEEMYKNIPWPNIAQLLPKPRTGVQALARWSEALDPRITKGKWTGLEDAALLRGVTKYGKSWIKIANGVKGRTQRQCRTRYCQISDKKRKVRGGPVRRMTGSPELDLGSE